jgi:hypothetical protein
VKQLFGLFFVLGAFPNASISEAINLDCRMGFAGSLSLTFDREAGLIGLVTATEIVSFPLLEAADDTVITFWMTPDGQQIMTLSLNTVNGEFAYTRVGTKEPVLREGRCSREE